ncbi:MAG: MATE family efflux transporter [Clostridia bacterium]|nr:MATE family efflux transporter [Clostridia bacterium]
MAAENKMGTMPVNKLLITMSLPMMASMLVQALYNVVDSIFVAMIGEDALTAVSMAFPMQMLMFASAIGTGVGLNALLSRSLGQKNQELADKSTVNAMFIEAIAFVIFFFVGLFLSRPFYNIQNAGEVITNYGVEYLQTIMMLSFGVYAQVLFERMLISTGRTKYSMITQMIGAVTNLILDPIMIFGLLGFPALGVRGAAIATVIGQCVAATAAIIFNVKVNTDINIQLKGFRPDAKVIGTILSVGIPSMIMQAVGSVMTFGFNKILIYFSTTAVAVFGVYFKLNSIIFMPIFGLNNGMVPIVAYNYGAENRKRMLDAIKYSAIYATALMIVGLILLEAIPDKLLMLFSASDDMLAIGVPALRIICIHFIFAGPAIILSSTFQALGYGIFSMFISLIRQLLVLLPAAIILAVIAWHTSGDVNLVWWSFVIAEISSLSTAIIFFRHLYKKVIVNIPVGSEL